MSLKQQTAIRRAELIKNNSIMYHFNLILQEEKYYGLAQISFELNSQHKLEDIPICFSGEDIQMIIVNNQQIEIKTQQNSIDLPKKSLHKGQNIVSILYKNSYNDGDEAGFVSFTEDNEEQFLFTHFQPYQANMVFPCFDQPDLKSKMKLTVVAPSQWRVISNEKQQFSQSFQKKKHIKLIQDSLEHPEIVKQFFDKIKSNQLKTTIFPQTKVISTYLYFVGAGNYLQKKYNKGNVPMSIFYTNQNSKQVLKYADFIMDVTVKCMAFFESFFGCKYPFNKYDQIFVQQLGIIGMQNAGIVTLNQPQLLPQSQASQYDLYYMALIVAHELAHHWFGNLVTMKWWDDLWLNQSFAQYISGFCLQVLKNQFTYKTQKLFQTSFSYFRQHINTGYQQDQRNKSTHSIRGQIHNTDQANSSFDGITYEKGAAVMRQLFYVVGDQNISKALKNYFEHYSWKNASITDLLEHLNPFFPKEISMKEWQQMWLEKPSLNIFETTWDSSNKTSTSKLLIKQKPFSQMHKYLRFHKTKIGIFNSKGQMIKNHQIIINNSATELTIDATQDIAAILLNYDCITFAQNIIDPTSLIFFMNNIDKIQDILTRTSLWFNIQSMVKLSIINITDYIKFIKNKLFSQPLTYVVEKILQTLLKYIKEYVSYQRRLELSSQIFNNIYQELMNIDDQQDEKIQILKANLIRYALKPNEIKILRDWLYDEDKLSQKRQLDEDNMWQIVIKVYQQVSISQSDKKAVYNYAKKNDGSQKSKEMRILCDAIEADEEQFQQIYKQLKSKKISSQVKQLKVQGWNNNVHSDLLRKQYKKRYFNDIIQLSQKFDSEELQFFIEKLQPIDDDIEGNINQYLSVINKLQNKEDQQQNIKTLTKIVDDLTLRLRNVEFNSK